MKRLLGEPLFHFAILGALLFLTHHLVAGDRRTIAVTPGLVAELGRRFRDRTGRAPSAGDLEESLFAWKRDEALFREALRDGLDRDDPDIRNLLIEKIRTRAALEAPKVDPTDAELDAWLAAHRERYERTLRYGLEWVAFPKGEPSAARQRDELRRKAEGGADPRFLGKPIFGANLTADDVRERLGAGVSEKLGTVPPGKWQEADGADALLLVRVNEVDGGLPPPDELRPRLAADLDAARRRDVMERTVDAIVGRYRFEEHR